MFLNFSSYSLSVDDVLDDSFASGSGKDSDSDNDYQDSRDRDDSTLTSPFPFRDDMGPEFVDEMEIAVDRLRVAVEASKSVGLPVGVSLPVAVAVGVSAAIGVAVAVSLVVAGSEKIEDNKEVEVEVEEEILETEDNDFEEEEVEEADSHLSVSVSASHTAEDGEQGKGTIDIMSQIEDEGEGSGDGGEDDYDSEERSDARSVEISSIRVMNEDEEEDDMSHYVVTIDKIREKELDVKEEVYIEEEVEEEEVESLVDSSTGYSDSEFDNLTPRIDPTVTHDPTPTLVSNFVLMEAVETAVQGEETSASRSVSLVQSSDITGTQTDIVTVSGAAVEGGRTIAAVTTTAVTVVAATAVAAFVTGATIDFNGRSSDGSSSGRDVVEESAVTSTSVKVAVEAVVAEVVLSAPEDEKEEVDVGVEEEIEVVVEVEEERLTPVDTSNDGLKFVENEVVAVNKNSANEVNREYSEDYSEEDSIEEDSSAESDIGDGEEREERRGSVPSSSSSTVKAKVEALVFTKVGAIEEKEIVSEKEKESSSIIKAVVKEVELSEKEHNRLVDSVTDSIFLRIITEERNRATRKYSEEDSPVESSSEISPASFGGVPHTTHNLIIKEDELLIEKVEEKDEEKDIMKDVYPSHTSSSPSSIITASASPKKFPSSSSSSSLSSLSNLPSLGVKGVGAGVSSVNDSGADYRRDMDDDLDDLYGNAFLFLFLFLFFDQRLTD